MRPENGQIKNKLDIPSDFAVYFLRNRTKSHKYSTNFFKNLERKCLMLNSKILVIFNPICLVSVKNRHMDQNQEKIGLTETLGRRLPQGGEVVSPLGPHCTANGATSYPTLSQQCRVNGA